MSDEDSGVRWVASQSPNPALQALITEAERDRTTRPPWSPTAPPLPRQSHTLASRRTTRPSTTHRHVSSRDGEPEATAFIELLKDTFRTVDENAVKKQRVAVRDKDSVRASSRATSGTSARPLTKTTSASAICTSSKESRASPLSAPPVSGKSTPASLPNQNLNRSLKHASAPTYDTDSPMQDVIDLTDTDTDWEKPISPPMSRADTTFCMDSDSDTAMDVSFFKPEPLQKIRPPAPKQPPQPRPTQSAPTQRARTGPPPLGMRRAPQLLSSQRTATQPSKGVTVPRFKPPLLANAPVATHRNGSTAKPATTSRPPPPPTTAITEATAQASQDPDSSFDVSFDVDVNALEDAMKAYD